jgi:hypothetical protein
MISRQIPAFENHAVLKPGETVLMPAGIKEIYKQPEFLLIFSSFGTRLR